MDQPQLPGNLAAVLNRLAIAVGALATILSTIYAAATSSPTLRGVIFGGTALAVTSGTREVHKTKRAAHAAKAAEAHAVVAVAEARKADAAAQLQAPVAHPGDQS